MKKITTLGLSFDGNYGGMLQCMALQRIVAKLVPVPCRIHAMQGLPRRTISEALCILKFLIRVCERPAKAPIVKSRELRLFVARCFKRILARMGVHVENRRPPELDDEDVFIVGSDQVWRPAYARWPESLAYAFLDFAPEPIRRRSIVYAASFGTEVWEGTPEETEQAARLLKQFKAVSVREHSGIRMCRELFGVEAVQMPDPTLLIEVEDYERIMEAQWTHRHRREYMAAYILDQSPELLFGLKQIAGAMGAIYVQNLMPTPDGINMRDRRPLLVPQWLRYFRECKFVVTNSFHGCVFAIVFNKPFVCLSNDARGRARFDSLLQTFHLESRLVENFTDAVRVLQEPINWDAVNAIHEDERRRGICFLSENLI